MRRILLYTIILCLLPSLGLAEPEKLKKVLMFPFQVSAKDVSPGLGGEVAAVLGSELSREGDMEILSGKPFENVVQEKKVDAPRLQRLMARADAHTAIWGTLTKLDQGYVLEAYALQREGSPKPRFFSISGKDLEDLINNLKDLAVQIGNVAVDRLKVGEIKIEGNKRIQKDAILNKLDVKPGGPFRKTGIGDEIKSLYSMGYFDDVQIKAEETAKGEVDLYITLKERPSVKEIELEGNKVFNKDNILDALTTKSFAVASVDKIHNDIAKLKKMYEKEGYFQTKIEYDLKEISPNEAKLVFKIDEGNKSYLTKIEFEGVKSIPEKDLKKIMNVKEKSWTWFIDETGTFTRDKLEENRMRLMMYYLDNGFVNVQVGAPETDIQDGRVTVKYPVREGNRFQIRKVDVDGDLVIPKERLLEALEIKPKTWFKRSSVGEDLKTITKLYNNLGYAYADVEPRQNINEKHDFVDITYRVNKGERVSIERVDIAGNERTRDKVIRRNVDIGEGDLYNADKFELTKSKLDSLEFFEAVKLRTSPGTRPDLMNVTVEVQEKKTGSLSAGLGYSSQDGAMGNINLKERNLFGLGIIVNAKANLSGKKNSYEGSVTYPWLFDWPVSATLRGYRATGREQNYTRESEGFGITVGFPLYGLWSMSGGIARDSSKLSGFERAFARSIVNYYKQFNSSPERFTDIAENSLSLGLTRDTRDSSVIPSYGARIAVGSRWTGFGGDVAFSNYFSEAVYYHKLFWKAIFKAKANGSLLQEFENDPIPFDRRLNLGGISSIRGYKPGEIGPKDKYGNILGGDRAIYTNLEVMFPVIESAKLSGVVFMDAGNAWNVSDSPWFKDVKAGYGVGLRWLSPMGPVRFEYGWKIAPEKGEEPGAFAFGMGQLF